MRNIKPATTHHPRQPEKPKRNRIDGRLRQLAVLCGAATSYVDEGGRRRLVSGPSLSRILAVLGVQAKTPEQVRQNLQKIRADQWREMMDPVMVVKGNRFPRSFALRLPVEAEELRRI